MSASCAHRLSPLGVVAAVLLTASLGMAAPARAGTTVAPGPTFALTDFTVLTGSEEVTVLFQDDFEDGSRDTLPTSALIDLGGSVVTELDVEVGDPPIVDGALIFSPSDGAEDDGAAYGQLYDGVALASPLLAADAPQVQGTFLRAALASRESYGIGLWDADYLPVFALWVVPSEEAPLGCTGVAGAETVIFLGFLGEEPPTACDALPPRSADSPRIWLVLADDLDGNVFPLYSLDGITLVDPATWDVPVPAAPLFPAGVDELRAGASATYSTPEPASGALAAATAAALLALARRRR